MVLRSHLPLPFGHSDGDRKPGFWQLTKLPKIFENGAMYVEVGSNILLCLTRLRNLPQGRADKTLNTLQQKKLSAKPVKKRVTLTFPKRAVQMPVTYVLAKEFNVAANIIRAQVAPNQIGKLVVELSGDIDQLDAAIEWMRSRHVNVSSTLGEIAINEDVCVHCGLCTGVCPTEALTLHPETYKLTFTRSRCIVCEQCIPSCPVQAISTNI